MDAPAGTFVFARSGVKRTAFAEESATTIVAIGGTPGKAHVPFGWELWAPLRPRTSRESTPRLLTADSSCAKPTPSTPGSSTTLPAVRASRGAAPKRSSTSVSRSTGANRPGRSPPVTQTSIRSATNTRSRSYWGSVEASSGRTGASGQTLSGDVRERWRTRTFEPVRHRPLDAARVAKAPTRRSLSISPSGVDDGLTNDGGQRVSRNSRLVAVASHVCRHHRRRRVPGLLFRQAPQDVLGTRRRVGGGDQQDGVM